MMKNSKLSKLLVAGVSVAMLASALAPMAFAEEASGTSEIETALKVYVTAYDGTTDRDVTKDNTVISNWEVRYGSSLGNDFEAGALTDRKSTTNLTFDLSGIALPNGYSSKGTYEVRTWDNTASLATNNTGVFSVADLYNLTVDSTATGNTEGSVWIRWNVEADPTAALTFTDNAAAGVTTTKNFAISDKNGNAKAYIASMPLNLTDKISLPIYTVKDGYTDEGFTVTVGAKVNGTTAKDFKVIPGVKMGTTIKVSDLGIKEFKKENPAADTFTITVTGGVKKMKSVKLTLAANTKAQGTYTDKNGKPAKKDLTYTATAEDLAILAKYSVGAEVTFDKTVVLPEVVVLKADGKTVDTDWTFAYWMVDCDNDVLTNGKPAKGYKIENGVFDPTVFKADNDSTGADTDLTLVPYFTKGVEPADEITYSPAKTPNDKVIKYVNGKPESEKVVYGDAIDFEGGAFLNEVDNTFSYYAPKNAKGVWEIDTTVDGVADGVYFEKGVQDTEAYGLKKVSGAAEDDKFFYLVSDGLYVDDHTGIWVDEDGSIYNLINGCTSDVPFTGIVEKDGWATSVKDSMVDNKANGFILYGDTQYWFINGTCNLNETEAVREHTDGNFYYTVGAKIDFTFNGECNGHTFVNGVASK